MRKKYFLVKMIKYAVLLFFYMQCFAIIRTGKYKMKKYAVFDVLCFLY